jgi:predicted dienelactone hydrolase
MFFVLPILIACSIESTEKDSSSTEGINPLDWDVNLPGPFRTGYTSIEETYTDLAGEERNITINIWYPTNDNEGSSGIYVGYLEDANVFSDASVAEPVHHNGFPLFVFSHGSFGYGGNSSFLMHHLTSHGFVVVAPDHKGNSVLDYGEDQVPMIKVWRAQDDKIAISSLEKMDWFDQVNSTEVILSGHSFGGWDNWLLGGGILDPNALDLFCDSDTEFSRPCTDAEREAFGTDFRDDRIKGIIPMAGAKYFDWFADNGRSNLSIPVYQMSGSDDEDQPEVIFEENQSTPLRWLEIQGGCHQAFALGACENISNEDAFHITKVYNLAFAREVLFQDASVTPLLDGDLSEDNVIIYK